MRLYTLFSFCCMFAAFVTALPYASPVEDSEFDMGLYLEDLIEENGLQEYFDSFYQNDGIHKRDEQTIEKALLLINRSGIIWEALDAVAGHPSRIQFLANQTAKLLNSSGGISIDFKALTSGVNGTELLNIVKDSGLITSILDGILLDDDYRPVLTDLIERVVRPNMFVISYLIHDVFQKRSIQKRADYGGSLATFAENTISTILGSKIFTNTLADIVNALNDTGVAVYTIKRFIADESYQNMTAALVKDIYDTGAIKFSGSLNITAIVGGAVSNPKAISKIIGKVLSGDLNLGSSLGKYTGAVKKIIKDLEDDGLFAELNDEVFPSSSTKASSTKSASQTKKEKILATSTSKSSTKKATTLYMYGNNKENSPTSSSDSGSISLRQSSNIPIVKCLIYLQTLIFGGALLLI